MYCFHCCAFHPFEISFFIFPSCGIVSSKTAKFSTFMSDYYRPQVFDTFGKTANYNILNIYRDFVMQVWVVREVWGE